MEKAKSMFMRLVMCNKQINRVMDLWSNKKVNKTTIIRKVMYNKQKDSCGDNMDSYSKNPYCTQHCLNVVLIMVNYIIYRPHMILFHVLIII